MRKFFKKAEPVAEVGVEVVELLPELELTPEQLEDAFLDHEDVIPETPDDELLSDEDGELFPLFAEALDPSTDATVDEVAGEWQELFEEDGS